LKVSYKSQTLKGEEAGAGVATTNTSNFRAMVKEFTGIAVPPFVGGATDHSRFDHLFPLLNTTATARTWSSTTFLQYLLPARMKLVLRRR